MGGVDLNTFGRYSELFRGVAREHRKNAVRPTDGFSALEHLHADCCALRRRHSGTNAVLHRAIPSDGVCATDLSREPARYRSMRVGSSLEALPHGLSRTGAAIDAGRCQRDARLAHLRRVRPWADCPGEKTLRRRKLGLGAEQHGLCSGLDHHRPVPVVVSMAHFRSTKAAVKMHTLLDLRGNIPSFIHISDGKLHDVHALDMLVPEAGAIYVMDRGYVDFARLHGLHQAGAFFVTRAKSNLNAHRVYSAATDRTTGVVADQKIALDGHYTRKDYPVHLRRVRFRDPKTGKTLVFLTNQTALPALTICDLYKSRWQVELFFKWIKQHLRIKQFYGTSENAVKTQIWALLQRF